MIETVLIFVLIVLVLALSASIIIRRRRTRGALLINAGAINDLQAVTANNVSNGNVQGVAKRVSDILRKHLRCDRIIFLKYYRSNLELGYFAGFHNINRNDFRIKPAAAALKKLRSFTKASLIADLDSILPLEYVRKLRSLGMGYFFPVFLRENLYGIYLIKTDLPADDASLNLLVSALSFNLSAAYHIGSQEQRIKKYEKKVRNLIDTREKESQPGSGPGTEILKYLRIRKCQQLIPELLKRLKRDCDLTKLGFYVKSNSPDNPLISVSWNIADRADKAIKESYDLIINNFEPDNVFDLKDISGLGRPLDDSLKNLQDNSIDSLMTISWAEKKKAVLAWSGRQKTEDIIEQIIRFEKEAISLVENINRYERAEELSYTDGLTGMYNFRYFQKRIHEELQRAKRYDRNLALLIFDIDDLKAVNDRCGHLAGDSLIKTFGKTLTALVRSNDIVSRYGGDEFCLIMPETDHEDAELFMERIRGRIAAGNSFLEWADKKLEYTVSTGGAVYPVDAQSVDGLIHSADMALLRAKSEGRNCSKMYHPEYDQKI